MKPGAKGLSYVKQYGTGPVFSLWNNPYNLIFLLSAIEVLDGLEWGGRSWNFCTDLILTLYSSITQDGC